jgi:mono/diheme cytochrome c family protein
MTTHAAILAVATGAVATMLSGCGAGGEHRALEYMPDMVRGPAYKAFAPNAATRTGLTLQAPVAGTIPRGRPPFRYGPGEVEAARAGRELASPVPVSPRSLAEGRALYETTCVVCHGPAGRGDGPLAGKIPPPPAYGSERVAAFPPGRIFHVITRGAGKMPSYAALLSPLERWKVVGYVASLQKPAVADTAGGAP